MRANFDPEVLRTIVDTHPSCSDHLRELARRQIWTFDKLINEGEAVTLRRYQQLAVQSWEVLHETHS
jgi:hypothetical protein